MAEQIIIDDVEKIDLVNEYRQLELEIINAAKFGVVPNLKRLIEASQNYRNMVKEGQKFGDFDNNKFRRLSNLVPVIQANNQLLNQFKALDQARIDAGKEQLFDSVDING